MQSDDYHALIEPEGVSTAFEGDTVTVTCSTNLPTTIARWKINDNEYDAAHLLPGFTTDGLNLEFILEERVRIRCFFKVIFGGSICSPEAIAIPQDTRKLL